MALNWIELPDGRQMSRAVRGGQPGTYFIEHDPTIEDGKPWRLTWQADDDAPKEAP